MSIRRERLDDTIELVTIDNRQRRNALGPQEFAELAELWPILGNDDGVRAVVVSGVGEHAFCSGADLAADFSAVSDVDDLVDRALLKTRYFPKPLIAAINGDCVAGGFELALSADFRIASVTARMGLPEVRWGILPSGGAAMKLLDQLGQSVAMELLLTGQLIDGREAERIGFVSAAVEAPKVLDEALLRARRVATASPVAVRETKLAALQERFREYRRREEEERIIVARVRASGHQRIGAEAFLQKRKPSYP